MFDLFPKNSLQIPKNFHISLSAADFKEGIGNPNLISCLLFLYWINPKFSFTLSQFKLEYKSFEVRLYIQGQPKYILVDSQVPVKEDLDQFNKKVYLVGFISTSEVNYWILLIEKAIAKISKSYGNTIRYYASEIYPLISEIPMIKIENTEKTKQKVWNLLFKASKKNWIIFSELQGYDSEDKNNKDLELSIEEEFMSIFIIKAFELKGVKYLELSSPFLKEDSNLKKLIQKNFDIDNIVENEFYFPANKLKSNIIIFATYDDYFNLFKATYFNKFEADYFYIYNRFLSSPNQTNAVRMKLGHKTKITLTMHMEQNIFNYNNCEKDLCLSKFLIAKYNPEEKSLKYVDSSLGFKIRHIIELELDDGEYFLFFKTYSNEPMSIVISSYSEVKPKFIIDDSKSESFTRHAESYLLSLFNSILQKNYLSNQINNNHLLIYTNSMIDNETGFKIIKIDNKSNDDFINMYIKYENLDLITHEKCGMKQDKTDNIATDNFHKTDSKNTPAKDLYLSIKPNSSEFLVFEYQKLPEETNIITKFHVDEIKYECNNLISQNQISQKRVYLTNGVFYFDIKYRKSIYIFVINDSDNTYEINVLFLKLKNLEIVRPLPELVVINNNMEKSKTGETIERTQEIEKVCLIIGAKKNDYIILKATDFDVSLFYDLNFELKQV